MEDKTERSFESRLDGDTAAMYVGARRWAVILLEGRILRERSDRMILMAERGRRKGRHKKY
jgi:hypothetical protein